MKKIEEYYIKHKKIKTVTIELINQCNWRCKHCYLSTEKIIVDRDRVYGILDELRNGGL